MLVLEAHNSVVQLISLFSRHLLVKINVCFIPMYRVRCRLEFHSSDFESMLRYCALRDIARVHSHKRVERQDVKVRKTKYTTLQHTATHCNTLQHTAISCHTLQHTATHYTTLHHTATRVVLTGAVRFSRQKSLSNKVPRSPVSSSS